MNTVERERERSTSLPGPNFSPKVSFTFSFLTNRRKQHRGLRLSKLPLSEEFELLDLGTD